MNPASLQIVYPGGTRRVIVTKNLPGQHWLDVLTAADCRVEICQDTDILSEQAILDTPPFPFLRPALQAILRAG